MLGSLFHIHLCWETDGEPFIYLFIFFVNIPFLETAANRTSPVIKEISLVGKEDVHKIIWTERVC